MFARHKSPTVTARKQLISSRKCSRGSSETALLQAHPTSSEIFWEERREQTLNILLLLTSVGGTMVKRTHFRERIFVPMFGNDKPKYGNAM